MASHYPKRRRRRMPDSVAVLIATPCVRWLSVRLWLLRVHRVKVAPGTISRIS